MTGKKKIIIGTTLIVTFVSILGFTMIAGAFGPDASFRGRCMPRFMQKDIGEFILWKMDKTASELNLDNAQMGKYDILRTAIEETLSTCLDTRLEFRQAAMAELEKEAPDLSSITTSLKTHIEDMSPRFSGILARFNAFYSSLNADQKKQITDRIKERHQARKNACIGLDQG